MIENLTELEKCKVQLKKSISYIFLSLNGNENVTTVFMWTGSFSVVKTLNLFGGLVELKKVKNEYKKAKREI